MSDGELAKQITTITGRSISRQAIRKHRIAGMPTDPTAAITWLVSCVAGWSSYVSPATSAPSDVIDVPDELKKQPNPEGDEVIALRNDWILTRQRVMQALQTGIRIEEQYRIMARAYEAYKVAHETAMENEIKYGGYMSPDTAAYMIQRALKSTTSNLQTCAPKIVAGTLERLQLQDEGLQKLISKSIRASVDAEISAIITDIQRTLTSVDIRAEDL